MRRWLVMALLTVNLAGFAGAQDRSSDARRDLPGEFVINRPAYLYKAPSADADILTKLRPKTVVDVIEVREQWYKVRSAKGNAPGWLRRSYADPFEQGGRAAGGKRFRPGVFQLTSPSYVYGEASVDAKKIATLKEGQEVRVVGATGTWYRIESESGDRPPGFIPTIAAKRVRDLEPSPE